MRFRPRPVVLMAATALAATSLVLPVSSATTEAGIRQRHQDVRHQDARQENVRQERTGHEGATQEHEHDHASPYADQGDSGIAALSPEGLRALREGEGMGLARAAELNHYPGPKHVLELADLLELTFEQREAIEAARQRMLQRARELGAEIIEQERILDRRFAHAHVEVETVRELSEAIGTIRGRLRAVHLVAHLETREVLDPAQIRAYDEARGYVPEG